MQIPARPQSPGWWSDWSSPAPVHHADASMTAAGHGLDHLTALGLTLGARKRLQSELIQLAHGPTHVLRARLKELGLRIGERTRLELALIAAAKSSPLPVAKDSCPASPCLEPETAPTSSTPPPTMLRQRPRPRPLEMSDDEELVLRGPDGNWLYRKKKRKQPLDM